MAASKGSSAITYSAKIDKSKLGNNLLFPDTRQRSRGSIFANLAKL